MVTAERTRGAPTSPIRVRTRFMGTYVNIHDLQSQLNRDAARTDNPSIREYALELVERLGRLKEV